MKITFCGAAHEVTGSCYLLDTGKKKILVDCGMFQGSSYNEGRNHDNFAFDPKEISVILVTHAHLDHVGRIPKLVRQGFHGRIYLTEATMELAKIVWEDALEVMKMEEKKYGLPPVFDSKDISTAFSLCHGLPYYQQTELGEELKFVFKDAGHIFGSAFIEINAGGRKYAFSGDIGNSNMPILRETDQLGNADVLLCESTYGDKIHEPADEVKKKLVDLIHEGYRKGGTIMVPAFSIERTQEFIYNLHAMSDRGQLPELPIFVDSPMAIKAVEVYKKYPNYYDEQAAFMYKIGDDFLNVSRLKFTTTVEESKKINNVRGPKMVIAGAGMMNGGRILHHALRYLPDHNSMLLIIGYQAQGTLGRRLYEGAEKVQIFGEEVPVRCSIKALGGLSAHGDQAKLLSWVRGAVKLPEKIYCVHGESSSATVLGHKFRDELGINSYIPVLGETVEA